MTHPERRIAAASALLAALGGDPAAAADDPARQATVEQKMRLVEMLVESRAGKGIAADGDPARAAMIEQRRQLLGQAHQALAAGRLGEAERRLDEALARSARASAQAGGRPRALGDSALDAAIANLEQQLASYRTTLTGLARGEGVAAGEARTLLARVDHLRSAAERHSAADKRADAHDRLREAYRLLVEGLARIQAGQTIVMSLKFDDPADEYAYEQRRFHSNELLLRMTLAGQEGDPARPPQQVQAFTAEAYRLRDEAEALSRRNDHAAAIALMERAYAQLNRALQALGVPAF